MQTTIPLYGFGGGSGGTGAALTVTAPAGATVTVARDGKSKTKVAGSSGVAVFKGLATGAWTVTITDGTQTAQKTVTITADYETAITFFAATIHVAYPAGSVCTATDGMTTLTAPDIGGTWDCVVPNAGTWTVSISNGFSETVTVAGNGSEYTIDKWYLYHSGDEYAERTGGWSRYNDKGTVSKDSDCMSFVGNGGATQYGYCLGTTKSIDLKGFKEIKFRAYGPSSSATVLYTVSIFNTMNYTDRVSYTTVAGQAASEFRSLDISTLQDGSYYIGITNGSTSVATKLYEMYLI